MNALTQVFTFNQSHKVRTININNEVWFVAKDVFNTLDVTWNGTRSLIVIPEDWRGVVKLTTPPKSRGSKSHYPLRQTQEKRGFARHSRHQLQSRL